MARADHIDPEARLDRFAELLSLDIPMPDICARMGLSRGGASAMMKKLLAKFGRQAQ